MAYLYEYKIGADHAGLTNVEGLTTPLPAPKSTFRQYSQLIGLGNGTVRGAGFPVATWRFGFLSLAQRDQLKTFCSGASAAVNIYTKEFDDTYAEYTAVMVWPQDEEKIMSKRLDFTVQFINLVVV